MTTEAIKFRQEHRRRKRLREITTHIVLLFLVFMYSYLGAKLFQSIEEKNEQKAKGNLIESKHHFLDGIRVGLGSPLVDQKNWTKMADRLLNYYVEDLAEATSHGVDITDVTQHEYESASKWDFWGSLFYAGTVFTTIGFGNFAPVTPEGKVATIVYGMIGIPLCLILLADLGNLIAKLIKYGVKKTKKQFYSKSKKNLRDLWPPQDEIDSMTGQSTFIVLCIVCVLYFAFGAFMYKTWEEDWSYLDAVYFIFVSTSTIGFGDVLPSQPKKFIFSSIYIFFGLSLLSSGFTIIQEMLENKITKAKTDIDTVLGIERAEHEAIKSIATSPEPISMPEKTTPRTETLRTATSPALDATVGETNPSATEIEETIIEQSDSNLSSAPPSKEPVMEERIVQQSDNSTLFSASTYKEPLVEHSVQTQPDNNNLFFAPNSKFEVPITPNTSGSSQVQPQLVPIDMSRSADASGVSETRFISLDDGILSVEATIILD